MKKKYWRILFLLLFPAAVLLMILLRDELRGLAGVFPPCAFNQITGKLCPACGNTRGVLALLQGDVLTSLRYNITPVIISLLFLLLYIERLLSALGKNVRILPRKTGFWVVFLVGMFFYYLIRNLM